MYSVRLALQNVGLASLSTMRRKGGKNMFFRSWGSSRSRAMRMPIVIDEQVPLDAPECDVVLTRDHEYYVHSGICIAVRERSSGRYIRQDHSLGVASIRRGILPSSESPPARAAQLDAREKVRSMPRVGEWLCLERGGTLHYVGPVIGCERRRMPSRRIVSGVMRRARIS
jgi:hypothetical protein